MAGDRFKMFPQPGDRVRVSGGTFQNMTGEVIAADRFANKVKVQLIVYGRPVILLMDDWLIEPKGEAG